MHPKRAALALGGVHHAVRNAEGSTRNAVFEALHEAARDARVGWCSWTAAVTAIESAARQNYADRGEALDVVDFGRSVKTAVCAANAESLPQPEARYAKRQADQRRVEMRCALNARSRAGVSIASIGATQSSCLKLRSLRGANRALVTA